MKNQFLMSEVARMLKVKPYMIAYALTSGLVKEPKLRMGGRRVFQKKDLQRLAKHFGRDLDFEQITEKKKEDKNVQ